MDKLDRYQEELERMAAMRTTFSKTEIVQPRSDIRATDYPVTIIGCIRGLTGWFRAGYDHRKEMIVPLERIARIHPRTDKTNTSNKTNTAEGRKQ